MKGIRLILSLAFLLSTVSGAGCITPVPPASQYPGFPSDNASIYAAVVRQLATKDDTFGGTLKPPKLFVIRSTSDPAGNPASNYSSATTSLPQEVQNEITANLSDLHGSVVWINKFRDGMTLLSERVKEGGVIITLGNIYPQPDSSIQMSGAFISAT